MASASALMRSHWFNTSRRCYPPTSGNLRHLAIMDFLLEDFDTIPKPLLERCSAVLGRQRGLGGPHGAYKVRTQVPHTAPPHERLPWFPP